MTEQLHLLPQFDEEFLVHHAGRIISDPVVAMTELVANAWDAGANSIKIVWPSSAGGKIEISDNGTGMTREEFETRWRTLHYNRLRTQGDKVTFPPGVRKQSRRAFGHNGIGRHAMFYFASSYAIRTKKGGKVTTAKIAKTFGESPFSIGEISERSSKGTGTTIEAILEGTPPFGEDAIREKLGMRFIADPDFKISVNGKKVNFEDLEGHAETWMLSIGSETIQIWRFDNEDAGRTARQNGVAYWVGGRLVGQPSWDGVLDSRRHPARRFTFIARADHLTGSVKKDWTGFHQGPLVEKVVRGVRSSVLDNLQALQWDSRKKRKKDALEKNRTILKDLPLLSQEHIAKFAEQVQISCPNLGDTELGDTVTLLANLEKSRTGYLLLEKLATLETGDLDGLHGLLEEWTVNDAKKVLEELRYRMELIGHLEARVDDHKADELHDLQPLFEKGLWIFGPEFEAVDFMSNRTLATIVREHFGDDAAKLSSPSSRPDFVAVPDASIGVYSQDSFDEDHEVCGIQSVVIVELKRGGFTLKCAEKDQALGYARALRQSGKVSRETKITAYVLGSKIEEGAAREIQNEGNTTIVPYPYSTILHRAHARTFHLAKKVGEFGETRTTDEELRDALALDQGEFEAFRGY